MLHTINMARLSENELQTLRMLLVAYQEEDDSKGPEIFRFIDRNGNGKASELISVMSQVCDQTFTEDDVNELIRAADTNNNGIIEINEFIEALRKDRD